MAESNPRAARLWHELYQDWKGPGDRSGSAIIVNIGIMSKENSNKQEIIMTDFDDINSKNNE